MPQSYRFTVGQKILAGVVAGIFTWLVLAVFVFVITGVIKYATWLIHRASGISHYELFQLSTNWLGSRPIMIAMATAIAVGVYKFGCLAVKKYL